MKYIKELNIDFNNWENIDDDIDNKIMDFVNAEFTKVKNFTIGTIVLTVNEKIWEKLSILNKYKLVWISGYNINKQYGFTHKKINIYKELINGKSFLFYREINDTYYLDKDYMKIIDLT